MRDSVQLSEGLGVSLHLYLLSDSRSAVDVGDDCLSDNVRGSKHPENRSNSEIYPPLPLSEFSSGGKSPKTPSRQTKILFTVAVEVNQ